MKEYSTLPWAPELEFHHQVQSSVKGTMFFGNYEGKKNSPGYNFTVSLIYKNRASSPDVVKCHNQEHSTTFLWRGRSNSSAEDLVSIFYVPLMFIKRQSSTTEQIWLGLVLWHTNHCRLFNAKYIWFVNIFCW